MPAKYEAIRNKFEAKGMSHDNAQMHAAKIYNATKKPGDPPLTHGKSEKKKKRKRTRKEMARHAEAGLKKAFPSY